MSQENVEILRRSHAAFKQRDRDATFADYHPDVELRDLMHAPDTPELIRGISALRASWDTWQEVFDDFTIEIDEYVDVGDCVLAVTHWRGKSKEVAFRSTRRPWTYTSSPRGGSCESRSAAWTWTRRSMPSASRSRRCRRRTSRCRRLARRMPRPRSHPDFGKAPP